MPSPQWGRSATDAAGVVGSVIDSVVASFRVGSVTVDNAVAAIGSQCAAGGALITRVLARNAVVYRRSAMSLQFFGTVGLD
jgi:hypothetical protein